MSGGAKQLRGLAVEGGQVADQEGGAGRRGPAARPKCHDARAVEAFLDVLGRAEHRPSQRMLTERGLVDQVFGHHGRLVVGPGDLLHHHAALAVQLVGVDPGPAHEVGQQVGGLQRPFGPGRDVKRDQVVARVGVEHRTDALCGLVDVAVGGEFLPALEHQVLQEMGHPVLLGALGSRARVEGDQDRGGAGPLERDPIHRQAVGRGGLSDGGHA